MKKIKIKKEILDNININDNPTKVMLSFLNEIANKSNLILDEWYKGEVIGDLEKGYLIKMMILIIMYIAFKRITYKMEKRWKVKR